MKRLVQHKNLFRLMGVLGVATFLACTPSEFVMKRPPASPSAKEYPKADAVVLLRKTKIHVNGDGLTYCQNTHVQVKVLTNRGAKFVRGAFVDYFHNHDKVSKFEVRMIRPGGTWESINYGWKRKMYGMNSMDMKSNPAMRARYFSDNRWKMNGVRYSVPGAVLESRYTKSGNTWMMMPFLMQMKIPVLRTEYTISVPSGVKLKARVFSSAGFPQGRVKYSANTDPDDSSRTLHKWVATKIPAIPTESGMQPWPSIAARVHTVLNRYRYNEQEGRGRNWNKVAAFYTKLVGDGEKNTPKVATATASVTKGASSTNAKIEKLFEFVSKDIRTIPNGMGLNGWDPQSADFTLEQRYGDTKAKATLLVAMLSAIGVKANQVLVRTRNHGWVDKSFPADFAIFNKVIVYLPGQRQFLDPSAKMLGWYGPNTLGSRGLVVDGDKGRVVPIGSFNAEGNVNHRRLELTRHKEHIDALFTHRWKGSPSLAVLMMLNKNKLSTDKQRKGWAKGELKPLFMGLLRLTQYKLRPKQIEIQNVTVKKTSDSDIEAKIQFKFPYKKGKNRVVYLPMTWIHSGAINSAHLQERKASPVYGVNVAKHINEVVFKKWDALEYPATTNVNHTNVKYQLSCEKKDQYLSYRREIMHPRPTVPLARHAGFRTSYNTITEADKRIVILRLGYGDKDKDGIPDNVDECPTVKGPKKYKGCPDRDGDGIVDIKDACPDVKGVPSEDKTKNGCPKIVLVKVTATEIQILQKIFFRTGSARIKKKSYPVLDQVAQVLGSRKDIRIRVEGHTDNRGPKKYNLKLSKRRAASVRKYLTDKGVEKERLESDGFGMNKPLVPNNSRKNRAKNRRVQFKVIKK